MANALSLPRPIADQMARPATALARLISDVMSPAVMAIPCLFLGVWASEEPGTYLYALLYFAVAVPLPVAYVVWMMKTGRVTDFHLPNRRDRIGPFVASIVGAAGAIALIMYLHAPVTFVAPVVTALAQTFLLFLVTLAWQISIHTATTAGLATYGILVLGSGASILALLVPVVAWARIYLGRHTLGQAVAGACLGCLAFTAMFALHGIVW